MAQAGTIKSISGTVTAQSADGQVRSLGVGDIVFENEIIQTGIGGAVVIVLADNKEISLGENAEMMLDETVIASVEGDDASVSDVEALQAALEAGENIDEIEEETAAGEEDQFQFLASYYGGDDTEGQVGTYLLDAADDEGGPDAPDEDGAGNADPVAADDAIIMDEDGVFTGQLPAATDTDGDNVIYAVGTPPVNGILVINPDGSYTYTPNPNYNGPDSFTYVIDDGNGGTVTYTVDIIVNPVNDVPVLTGDEGDVVEDVTTSVSGQVTIEDIDEGESFFRPSELTGEYGSFVLDANGNWTYTLNNDVVQSLPEGATLTESFEVVSLDGTATETVTITITGTNDVPVITGEATGNVVEDGETLLTSGKLDIVDVDEGESSFQPTEQEGSYGSFAMDENGNWTYQLNNENGAVQALPAGVTLTETFEVISFDGTATETVTITITGTNDVPVITGVASGDVVEDGEVLFTSGKLDIVDVDTGESSFQPAEQAGEYGSFAMDENGNWTYTLNNEAVQFLPEGVTRTETFEVISFDGTATETVTITITGTNDVPVITGEASGDVVEDGEVLFTTGKLDIADADEGESSFEPSEQTGIYGSFAMDENGNWTYTLNNENSDVQALPAEATLTESFVVYSFDGTATETVTVTITGTNDVPVISGDNSGDLVEDVTLTAAGKLDIADVDTGESFFQPSQQSGQYGSFVMDENGSWTYELNNQAVQSLPAGATLTEEFEVLSLDGTASETVVVTITGTNDVPEISGDKKGTVYEDGEVLFTSGKLDIEDIDEGESYFRAQEDTAGRYGTFSVDENGNWVYDLNNDAVQYLPEGAKLKETFTVVSLDGTATQKVTVTIVGTNDVPVISGKDEGYVTEDQDVFFGRLITGGMLAIDDADLLQDFFKPEIVSGDYGTFTVGPLGVWTYTAANGSAAIQSLPEGATLTETFTVTSIDGSATHEVTVTITGTNDVPIISGQDSGTVTEDSNFLFLSTNGKLDIVDVDTGESSFKSSQQVGKYGAFVMDEDGNWKYTALNLHPSVQSLPAGATLTEEFTVESFDGTATETVTVTIVGTNDVPLMIGDFKGTAVEDVKLGTSGRVFVLDIDTGESSVIPVSDEEGTYGKFNIDANGNWTYELDNDNAVVQALPAGAKVTDTFEVTSFDGTVTKTVTVTITGTNDQPEVEDVSKVVFEDGRVIDGQLEVTDVDTGDTHTFALVDDAPDGFTLNSDGSWSFDPDNDAYDSLAKGDVLVLKIPYTATDDSGALNAESEEGMITIKVIGTNDRPEVEDVEFGVYENGAKYTGQLDVTDVDEGDNHIFLPASKLPAGFILLPNGEYSFNPSNPAYESLREGEEITLTVKYVAVDDSFSLNSISETGTITITVTGTNDQPCVKDVFKTVYEGGNEISGQVQAHDIDSGDTHTFALVDDAPAGFTFNSDGTWSFDPADSAYDSLAKGEILVLKIPFTATDDSGSVNAESDEGYITIKIKGTNDAPVIDLEADTAKTTITYDSQSAGFDNAIGVYWLDENGDPVDPQIILDGSQNTDFGEIFSMDSLPGNIQFFIIADGASIVDGSTVLSFDENGKLLINGEESSKPVYYSEDGKNPEGLQYVSITDNGDGTSTIEFEDQTDEDFNDVVLTLTAASFSEGTGYETTYVENAEPVSIASETVEITDVDDTNIESAVIRLTNAFEGDFLSVGTLPSGIDYEISSDGTTVTLTGSATLADYQEAIKAIGFASESENPATDDRYVEVTVNDGDANSNTAVTVVKVVPVNDAPVAVDDSIEVEEDGSKTFGVLGNDYDVDGDDISIDEFTQPAHGTVTLNQDGTFTYVPDDNYNGEDSFTYTIADPDGETSTATVNINVTPVNDAPVATDDGRPNFSFTSLAGNYYAVSTEFNGLNGSTYNNDNGYLIDNLNEFKHIVDTTDPVASFDATKIWYGYGTGSVSQGNNLAGFLNQDGDSLSYNGGQVVNSDEGGFHVSGKVYIEAGTYNFKVYADDGYDILIDGESVAKFENNQSPATHVHDSFTIEESGWYDIDMYWWDQGGEYVFQPSISDDGGLTYTLLTNEGTYVTDEDTAIDFDASDLLDNDFDVDGDDLTIIGVGSAVNGEVVLNDDGSVTFTPDADYNGPAQFEYTISDGNGGEDTATVYLVVSPVNDAPVAADDEISLDEGDVFEGALPEAFDADGDDVSYSLKTPAGNGTVEINEDGSYTYTPNDDFSGEDSFEYTVDDGNGGTNSYTVSITVNDTNDVPVAQDDFAGLEEGVSTSGTVNLVLVLDTSTSMNDMVGGKTRLEIAKAALNNLIDKYGDSLGSVMLVDFNDKATLYTIDGEKWLTGDQAQTAINGLTTKNYTDYDHAIEVVRTSYTDAPEADKTYVYFLSDGEPMGSDGSNQNTISNGERETWTNFLNSSDIDEVFAVGVGSGVSTTNLETVAWTSDPDGDHSGNVIPVTNENQLSAILEGTVELNSVEGNLLDNDDFGDDGAGTPQLVSVEYNGVTVEFDSSTTQHTFDLGEAGKVTIYSDGKYEYTSGADVAEDATAEIKYVIQDADGETSEATLTLTTEDRSEVFAADNANHAIINEVTVDEIVNETDIKFGSNSTKVLTDDDDATSDRFDVSVGSGQTAEVSFNYLVENVNNQNDTFEWTLQKYDGSGSYDYSSNWDDVEDGTVKVNGNGTVTIDNLSSGKYRLVFYTDDRGSGTDLKVTVSSIVLAVVTAGYTYLEAVAAEGNVLTDANNYLDSDDQWGAVDDMGSEGAAFTVFNGTDYVAPDAAGTTIAGDYGTLVIKADGSYSYTPADADGAGQSETFEYKLTQPDGDSDTAQLVISIGSEALHEIYGTDGADTITFDPTADLIDAGAGYDTLIIGGGELDFSNIADVVRNIEEIDLTDGDNTLNNLTLQDVLSITDEDNALVIRGNEGDFVTIDNSDGAFAVDGDNLVVNDGSANISFEGNVSFEVTDTHIKVTFTDDGTEIGG
ncbi:retention module-containing protein [Geovibrio thiophilus]|uniref:Retention module-containing protein n=1 Tax=Geovibrio thiophilus TaxID=139438 RepID=A0A410JYS0_9BACT|nr:retention module-containing protein [Geovibrio thiophilus]QAR33327.1 retention module-containing protein [Geovibrio thiophilus]